MRAAIRRWWEWATRPAASISDPEIQAQARLVNALLLMFVLLISALTILILLFPTNADIVYSRINTLLFIITMSAANYFLLARRGYHRTALNLMIGMGTVAAIGAALAEENIRALYYLPLLIMLGGVLISARTALAIGAAHIGLLVALAQWHPVISMDTVVPGPVTYSVMVLVFTVFMTRHRTLTTSYRRQMLSERDDAYQQLVENITDIICTLTPNGDVVSANRALTRVSGWPLESVVNKPFGPLVHTDDRPAFEAACQDALKLDDGAYCEVRVQGQDGAFRWWDIKMTRHYNRLNRPEILCIVRDITQRKSTEAALRASETKFMTAFRANPDSININRVSDGLYIEINDGFTNIMGYAREDVIGKTSLELNIWADPADRARMVESLQVRGQIANLEAGFIDKYGRVHIGLMSARVIDVDGELCAINITRDVTEQKRMEAELRRSEERYRMISELISDFAFSVLVQPDGSYYMEWMTNESFAAITGYQMVEIAEDAQRIFHPDDHDRLNADLVEMIKNNAPSEGDYRMVTRSGDTRWLHITRRPVWDDAEGRVVRYYGAARDITPLKLAEAERIRRVLQSEQSAMTGRFVLAISHDFRTSLSIIETSRYLIERMIAAEQREIARPKLERIHEAVQHMADQLDNLTRASAMTQPQMQPTDLYPLLDALVHKHRPAAENKGLQLHFAAARDLPPVTCNGDDIQRAVEHLLTNALQFTMTGEVGVHMALDADAAHMLITVRDTGPGIAPEHLPHIFDFFFRVDPSRQVSAGGVGLGLSLVRLIARAHNGTIDVVSTPGAGSIFTLRLPREPEPYPASFTDLTPGRGA